MKKQALKTRPKAARRTKSDWIERHAVDAKEVRAFCRQHSLLRDGQFALLLLEEQCHPRAVRVSTLGDPDGSSEWLIFEFDMEGDVDTVLDAYDKLKTIWVAQLTPKRRDFIRFTFNIIKPYASSRIP